MSSEVLRVERTACFRGSGAANTAIPRPGLGPGRLPRPVSHRTTARIRTQWWRTSSATPAAIPPCRCLQLDLILADEMTLAPSTPATPCSRRKIGEIEQNLPEVSNHQVQQAIQDSQSSQFAHSVRS